MELEVTKKENVYSNRELAVIILLYLLPISYMSSIVIPNAFLFYVEKILFILFFIWTISFNKFRFSFRSIITILIPLILFLVNALLSKYPTYVLAILGNFIVIFIPTIYLIDNNLKYKNIIDYWHKFSVVFTLLLPLFIGLYSLKKIGYYEVGLTTHINVIALAFSVSQKGKKIDYVYLIINILVGLVFGSRSVFLASIVLTIVIYVFFKKNKNFSFYLLISVLLAISIYILNNLITILLMIQTLMIRFGITSRNLFLFIQQLSAQSTDIYLSGRDSIYPVVIEHLKTANGLPEGVGIARILTNGQYGVSIKS